MIYTIELQIFTIMAKDYFYYVQKNCCWMFTISNINTWSRYMLANRKRWGSAGWKWWIQGNFITWLARFSDEWFANVWLSSLTKWNSKRKCRPTPNNSAWIPIDNSWPNRIDLMIRPETTNRVCGQATNTKLLI